MGTVVAPTYWIEFNERSRSSWKQTMDETRWDVLIS